MLLPHLRHKLHGLSILYYMMMLELSQGASHRLCQLSADAQLSGLISHSPGPGTWKQPLMLINSDSRQTSIGCETDRRQLASCCFRNAVLQ
jgi:hypothetical protein